MWKMAPFHVSGAAMFCSAVLLLTLLSGTTTSSQNTTTPSLSSTSCEPAACGGLRITYPFWLSGMQSPDCGYRAFQVTCDGTGTASLKNSIWRYQILEISYDDSTFKLANYNLSDGTCDIELHVNASSDLGLAPFYISATPQPTRSSSSSTTALTSRRSRRHLLGRP
uniref:Wall-associated receptor kinase galacturonan-binding domain-containing protein n=1 Tax=Triticum urartu TaxID=4572 RepID=A0A8R7TR53_TRIUA